MYGHLISNSVVTFFCDNEAVCHIINKFTSKKRIIMYFVRHLVLKLIELNIDLRAVHVPGAQNDLCDAISRFQVTKDLLERHGMRAGPDCVPRGLRPSSWMLRLALT